MDNHVILRSHALSPLHHQFGPVRSSVLRGHQVGFQFSKRAEELELSFGNTKLLVQFVPLPNGLAHFHDTDELMQHRAKIVRYPVVKEGDSPVAHTTTSV